MDGLTQKRAAARHRNALRDCECRFAATKEQRGAAQLGQHRNSLNFEKFTQMQCNYDEAIAARDASPPSRTLTADCVTKPALNSAP